MPKATSANAARSDVRESRPIAGTSQVRASANATAMPARIIGGVAARTGLGSRVRVTRNPNSAASPSARTPSARAAATSPPLTASLSATPARMSA